MMISAINSGNSFKGVYSSKGVNFSKSQLDVIENIKTTLDDVKEKRDFMVYPRKNDTVELTELICSKTRKGIGVESDYVTFRKELEVGIYDLAHPFKIEDLDDSVKEYNSNNRFGLLFFGAAIAGFLLALFCSRKPEAGKEIANKTKTEIIENIDTFKNGFVKTIK